jgi:hypothetical protein
VPLVTAAQVKSMIGVDVSAQDLAQAEADVDRVAGIDLDDADQVAQLKSRDLKLLKWAVTYQSAWRSEQIDMHARLDVVEIAGSTSDGGVKGRDELTLTLAPLCRSNLERISWKRKSRKRVSLQRGGQRGRIHTAAEIHLSTDPMDTPDQLDEALRDAGPYWDEAPDRVPR